MGAGFTVGNGGVCGLIRQDSSSFASPIDRKGRALLSSNIRKLLGLKFGSPVVIKANGTEFETKVDERGRFVVPAEFRSSVENIAGEVVRFKRGEKIG